MLLLSLLVPDRSLPAQFVVVAALPETFFIGYDFFWFSVEFCAKGINCALGIVS